MSPNRLQLSQADQHAIGLLDIRMHHRGDHMQRAKEKVRLQLSFKNLPFWAENTGASFISTGPNVINN